MRIPFHHRLSYRQAMGTVLIAFILGAVLSGVQIGYDLFTERRQVDSTVSQVIGMLRESAAQAVFNVDRSMTNTVINGLFEYKPICEALIIDEFDTLLAHKERPMVAGRLKWLADVIFDRDIRYAIPLFYQDEKEPIGSLNVSVDNYHIAKNFISRSGLVLIGGFIRNIVLSCILTLSFYYTLTHPLLRMVRHVSSVDPAGSVKERIEVPKGHGKDEMGLLVRTINSLLEKFSENLARRRAADKELKRHQDHLEQLVADRTSELQKSLDREHEISLRLNQTLEKVEDANKETMAGIRYAELIQKSLLPNLDEMKTALPDSFFIWMPKEIVGGDIFFADFSERCFVMAVVDCTGHGVPGAFMTMIAYSGLSRIIKDEGCHDPAEILRQLNSIVKTTLHQDTEHALSNDGLDAAVCFVTPPSLPCQTRPGAARNSVSDHGAVTFAGARLPLFYSHDGQVETIRGDRQSIGYRRSDLAFEFSNHTVPIEPGMSFYMATDGFADQLGGENERRLGNRRFMSLITENIHLPFGKQREALLRAFEAYRNGNERQDDVTIVGFGF